MCLKKSIKQCLLIYFWTDLQQAFESTLEHLLGQIALFCPCLKDTNCARTYSTAMYHELKNIQRECNRYCTPSVVHRPLQEKSPGLNLKDILKKKKARMLKMLGNGSWDFNKRKIHKESVFSAPAKFFPNCWSQKEWWRVRALSKIANCGLQPLLLVTWDWK